MNNDIDFCTLSNYELAEQVVAMIEDLEDESTSQNVTLASIMRQVDDGLTIIERDHDAIAIIHPEGYRAINGNAVLWLLVVKRASRGKRIGRAFVRHLVARHAKSMPMVLVCNGSRRESFFANCGFRIKEYLDDGSAVMVSDEPQ